MKGKAASVCILVAFVGIVTFSIWAIEASKPVLVTHWHDANAIPQDFQANWERLKAVNARDFRPVLLDDKSCKELLDDRQRRAYDQLVPLAYKSDMCRYAFLHRFGGLYTDIKFSSDVPLKELYTKQSLVRDKTATDVCNGFMTARPSDPLMKRALDKLVDNVEKRHYGENALDVTGPKMLGAIVTEEDSARAADLGLQADDEGIKIVDLAGRDIAGTKWVDGNSKDKVWHRELSNAPHYSVLWDEKKVYVDGPVASAPPRLELLEISATANDQKMSLSAEAFNATRYELAVAQSRQTLLLLVAIALTAATIGLFFRLLTKQSASGRQLDYALIVAISACWSLFAFCYAYNSSVIATRVDQVAYVVAIEAAVGNVSDMKTRRALQSATSPPAYTAEYGIVVCAGGFRNVECAGGLLWVRELERRKGLPSLRVEWYYVGDDEVPPAVREMLKDRIGNVRFVDCEKLYDNPGLLRGFPIKPFALTKTSFRQVILLDSDCISVRHPSEIFASSFYRTHGNIFWPDYASRGKLTSTVLNETVRGFINSAGITISNEDLRLMGSMWESESGQVLVDRARFASSLDTAWALNEHSVTYKYAYGDKDLFAVAFLLGGKLSQYAQVPVSPFSFTNSNGLHEAIGQRNPDHYDEVAFVHRTHQKLNCISGTNPCLLLAEDGYKNMVLEEDGANFAINRPELLKKAKPVHPDVKEALRFVANAESEILDAIKKAGMTEFTRRS